MLRYIVLLTFIFSVLVPFKSNVSAAEFTFNDPTFLDISATASQSGGVLDSHPISGEGSASAEQYCKEKGLFLANYSTQEPTPFGTKAWFNTSTELWETRSTTEKSISEVTCTDSIIVWQANAGVLWDHVYWNGTFTAGSATGSVSDVKIKARVNPTLNMSISNEEIDLGVLVAGSTATGSLFLEIGTNAKSGVSITARSQSGGLTHTTDAAVQINDLATDGLSESYTWESTPNIADDSSSTGFLASGLTNLEINDDTTEHTIYTTNKGEAVNAEDDVEFIVNALVSAETPAGDYEDHVTFTVTGNF